MQLMPGVTADKLVHSAPGIEPIVKTLLAQKCHLHNVAWSQPGGPGSQSIKAYYMAEMEGTPEKLLMEVPLAVGIACLCWLRIASSCSAMQHPPDCSLLFRSLWRVSA